MNSTDTSPFLTDLWIKLWDVWPYDERMLFVMSSVLGSATQWIIGGVLTLCFYWNLFPEYKVQKNVYPPTKLLVRCLIEKAVTEIIARPIATYYLIYPIAVFFGIKCGRNDPVPSLFTIGIQLAFFIAANDTLFYWTHRTLHHRYFYKWIHKQHHEFRTPVSAASEYVTVMEYVIAGAFPTLAGPFLVGPHIVVFTLWVVIRETETICTHSGYKIPFSVWEWLNTTARHDFHHSHNVGSYGAYTPFWDTIMGTDKHFQEWQRQQKEKSKHN